MLRPRLAAPLPGAAGEARHGRVRYALSGAAPIAPQVLEFFWALGVPVLEGYGMTENTARRRSPPSTGVRLGNVGRAVPDCEVRIADDGEILDPGTRGRSSGTSSDPEATADAIDPDGWLHTGDVGELDDDGYLTITDRKKDIIITAGGKNICPSEIENSLKVSPYVARGDRHRRPAQVPGRADRHRARHRRQLGPAASHRLHHLCRPVLEARGDRADRRGGRTGQRGPGPGRDRSSGSPCSPRSSTTRTAR